MFKRIPVIAACLLLCGATAARALTVDKFNGNLVVASDGTAAASATIATASAIGGHRTLQIYKTSGAAQVRFSTGYGMLLLRPPQRATTV